MKFQRLWSSTFERKTLILQLSRSVPISYTRFSNFIWLCWRILEQNTVFAWEWKGQMIYFAKVFCFESNKVMSSIFVKGSRDKKWSVIENISTFQWPLIIFTWFMTVTRTFYRDWKGSEFEIYESEIWFFIDFWENYYSK